MSTAKDEGDPGLEQNALACFGAITASVTHELNNVLAIIEQVSGLLEDMVAAQNGRPIEPEKILNVYQRLSKQVDRGVGIIRRLNAFAHSADESNKAVDLATLLGDFAGLCERFVNLRKQSLEIHLPTDPLMVRTNPYYLQWATFLGLQHVMEIVPPEGKVSMALQGHPTGAQIIIAGSPVGQPLPSGKPLTTLREVMSQLRGDFVQTGGEQAVILTLTVPQISREEEG
jgi:hypothetical protein